MDKQLTLMVLECEEIYSHMYELLARKNAIKLLGVYKDLSSAESITANHPDVLLVGTKKLDVALVSKLHQSFESSSMGIIMLFNSCNQSDIEKIRKVILERRRGFAIFMRQSLDHTDQLFGIIKAVDQGQIILDPALTNLMFSIKDPRSFFAMLTHREREVLQLLARGYTNAAIAKELYIDVKTVEHHLNNIYSKIKTEFNCDNKHPRVAAARFYLEEAGELNHTIASLSTDQSLIR